jgi:hypothetical protein
MRVVAGNCRGTALALTLCIGFVPDWVKIYNYDDGGNEFPFAYWMKYFSTDAELEGYENVWDDMDVFVDYTQGEGIQPYYGGATLNSTTQPSVVYGHANVDYVTWDDVDYRFATGKGPHSRTDSAGDTIDKWTIDTLSAWTGHFNAVATGTYIGAGSRICIDGVFYSILVLSASGTANDVELSAAPVRPGGLALTSGAITKITGKYGNCGYPMQRGDVTPAGFKMLCTSGSVVNVATEMFMFEAGTYDN